MMKQMMIPALVLASVTAAAAPAAAQSYNRPGYHQNYNNWQPINARLSNLDRRIDVGLRNGQLSRREAARLRAEFNSLLQLEANYRRGGLTGWERSDLDRRFDRLSAQIRYERADGNYRRY